MGDLAKMASDSFGKLKEGNNVKENLDDLLKRINKEKVFYSYRVDKKRYVPIVNGVELDGYYSEEDMIGIFKLTDHIINLYRKSGYSILKGNDLYVNNGFLSITIKDMYIDNRPTNVLDTTFLSQEGVLKNLPNKKTAWLNDFLLMYASFLNKVLKKM